LEDWGGGGATTTIDRGDWRWGERTPGPSLRIPGPAWYAMRSPFSHGPPLSLRHHIDGNTGGIPVSESFDQKLDPHNIDPPWRYRRG